MNAPFLPSRPLAASNEPARDTEGPAGTYGCACMSRDARSCFLLRYGYAAEDEGMRHVCECMCHVWRDENEE